jgi:hypothetical protein
LFDDWSWLNYLSEFFILLRAASIPPMRYTDDQPPPSAGVGYADSVVIFSVKVTQLKDSLEWPLDVYGIVAARDSLDRNRNLIFNRTRDNCQKLTPEVYPYMHGLIDVHLLDSIRRL